MSEQSKAVRERLVGFAAALGRLGGKAGRGASQVRGDSDHYRALVAKRKDRACFYCDRRPATREAIYEPTDRGTYAPTTRVVCAACAETYRRPPFGFRVE